MVYVIKGSEDGIISVQGSYKKAFNACVQYLNLEVDGHPVPSSEQFKATLVTSGFVCIDHPSDGSSCEVHRLRVE